MKWMNISLKSKLILFIVVGVVLVLASSTAVIITTVTSQEEDLAYQQSIEKSKSYANHFNVDMERNHAIGQTIANSMAFYGSSNRSEVNDILEEIAIKNPDLLGTYVCYEPDAFDGKDRQYIDTFGHDETGRFIPYWNRLNGKLELHPLLDYETSDYYALPKQLEQEIITEPYYYEGVFIVSYVTPIIREDEFIGIGGVDVSLSYLDEVVSEIKAFDTGYAFMTGNTGILISQPEHKEWIGYKTLYDFDVPEINRMADDIKEGKSGYIETIDEDTGKINVMFYEPIKAGNFSFILVVPKDEMLAGVTELRNRLLIISAMAIVFMAGVSVIIAGFVTRPINEIVADFKDISDAVVTGNLDVRSETNVDVDFKNIPMGLNEIIDAFHEITEERKRAEQDLIKYAEELEKSNKALAEMERVIENSPAVVFKWKATKGWPIEFVSRNISQFGYTLEDFSLFRINYADIVHPNDLERVENELQKQIESESNEFTIIYRLLTKYGEIRWVDERTFIIRDDEGNVTHLQGIVVNIDERKKAEETLMRMEEIRKKEIHHRIKNNLQVISTLLYLESEKFKEKEVIDAFKDSRDRVRTMALVHEKLYQSEDMESIDFSDYSKNLLNYLYQSYVVAKNISMDINVDDVFLGMDTAVPLGIITNELVSNSFKYAFKEKDSGKISVNIKHKGSKFTLVISDDGCGIPEDIDYRETESLGLQLVTNLVEQIDGTIELDRSRGTKFIIHFTDSKHK